MKNILILVFTLFTSLGYGQDLDFTFEPKNINVKVVMLLLLMMVGKLTIITEDIGMLAIGNQNEFPK
ncbi:MAG: hypothetical protein PF489_06455 [Salinivirgaceae bacterium]|jgi:hypothetical protein|nr:hypothetical protein [Salinivirgaceae bacterium]